MNVLKVVSIHQTTLTCDDCDWFWWFCTECYGFKISKYEIAGEINACSWCLAPANYGRLTPPFIQVMPPGLDVDVVYAAYNLGGINAARPIIYQHLWGEALRRMGEALCS